ncbi:MAG: hypothetical protein LBE75_09875 [Burkholderiales bacterium]|jgi:hypothetical protein|nr:hypothetical protein [Burkholderiales bacterium]
MNLPLILSDQGDVAVFETMKDLESYVESPDAADCRVYDASGRRYFFKGYREPCFKRSFVEKVEAVHIDREQLGLDEAEELTLLLRSYLQRSGLRDSTEGWPLRQLLKKTIEISGYTR